MNFNSLGPIYSSIMTNQTTSGLQRQIGPFLGPYLDIGPNRDQVLKSGLECKHWFDARGYEAPPAGLAPPAGPFPPCWVQGPAAGGVEYLSKGSHNLSFHWGHDPLAFGLPCVVQRFYSL